jgi:heat shock protein HtpX
MPFTFIEIEEAKTRRIWIFFLVLILLHFAVLATLAAAAAEILSLPYDSFFSLRIMAWLTALSLASASFHFGFSTLDAIRFLHDNLATAKPDPEDGVHQRLLNILQEIQVVTGNKRRVDCAVIPTLAMNALAAVDFRGHATIAITEGLLSRLTRPQLEAVMAHESYHILSGDCLETTVAASLFGLPAAALEKLSGTWAPQVRLSPAFLLTWGLLKLSQIFNMFISREREYRADAGSVRMTRNPLALAEALDLISRNWRGVGSIGEGFEMLCIVSPTAKALDETEGRWADLMSTHPPIRKRIDLLLSMAHVGLLERIAKTTPTTGTDAAAPSGSVFYALDPQHQWQGPYTLPELSGLSWISPLSWISVGGNAIERAWRTPGIDQAVFANRLAQDDKKTTTFLCPSCRQPLLETLYERTQLDQCHFCGGVLVENAKIPRIMARTENSTTDRIKSLSRAVMQECQLRGIGRHLEESGGKTIPLRNCPKCSHPMMRTFYTLAYPVQIDRCSSCGLTWFDPDELEILQYMIVNKMAADSLEQKTV